MITEKKTCMHVIYAKTHICVTQLLWPSPAVYCSGNVHFLCQNDLEHWGDNCFQNPVQRLRDSGQVYRQNKEVWIWNTPALKNRKRRRGCVLLKKTHSSHLHCKTCTPFIPALIFTQIACLPHFIHLVMPLTYSRACTVYMTCAHMISSHFLCWTAPMIHYHVIIVTFKLKLKGALCALVNK